MTLSMHAASVPVFQQMLTALGGVLAKAESHAVERKIEPTALLQAQFFFHVTTAYNLLRHNGVEIGKKDFMGAY